MKCLNWKEKKNEIKNIKIKETKWNKIRGYNFLLKFFQVIVNFVFVKIKNKIIWAKRNRWH